MIFCYLCCFFFFFSSRRRHTRLQGDWSSDVCSSDLVVLFPGVSLPIGAGRPRTLRAIESALKSDSHLIFAVAQRENVDTVNPGVLYTTGTIAKISQIQRGLGGVQLLLHGESRATALHYSENGRYLEAVVREVEDLRSEEHTSELQSPCNLVC